MELLYIAIGVVVLVLIFKLIVEPSIRYKKVYQMLLEVEKEGFIVRPCKDKSYDFTLENENLLMFIKILAIPKNSCVTINSKYTWKLSWGGSTHNKGRVYPNSRYLNEIVTFLKDELKENKPTLKVILLYPDTEQVLRYLNESELEVITSKKQPHGYKVVRFKSFVQEFADIINIK